MADLRNDRMRQGLSGGELSGIGIQFALIIVLFTFGGIWLDRRLGTSPWLLLVCVFVGAGGGFFSIYCKAMDAQRRDDERRRSAREQRQ